MILSSSLRTPLHRPFLLFVLAAAVLAIGACGDTDPTAPASTHDAVLAPMASGHAPASPARPFHLHGEGALAGQVFAPGFGPPSFGRSTFDGRCSVPSDFVVSFTIAVEATHMGATTGFLEHCSQVVDFAARLATITDGRMTMVAADGDEVWTEYVRGVGEGEPEIHTVVGGTGRFAGAWGELAFLASCDRTTGTCVVSAEGTLGYAASDRSSS